MRLILHVNALLTIAGLSQYRIAFSLVRRAVTQMQHGSFSGQREVIQRV